MMDYRIKWAMWGSFATLALLLFLGACAHQPRCQYDCEQSVGI